MRSTGKLRSHVRHNLVGYIAVFIALSGTGYAAKPMITGADIENGSITDTDINAANKDGTATTPSLRTLGTGAQQAVAGNDSRLSDARTPTGAAGGDLAGTYPNPSIASGALDTASFSSTIPAARVIGGIPAQSVPNRTHIILTLSTATEDYDTAGLHDTSTNTSRLTAPVAGIYRISAVVEWSPNPSGERALRVLKNNVTQNSVNEFAPVSGQHLSTEFKLAAGDRVELAVSQDSGTDLLVFAESFTMSWVAPG